MIERLQVAGLVELKKFPIGEYSATLYLVQDGEMVSPADKEQIFKLAQESLPGYPSEKIVASIFEKPGMRVIFVRDSQHTIVAVSAFEILTKSGQLPTRISGEISIVPTNLRGLGMSTELIRLRASLYRPPVIYTTAAHPGIYKSHLKMGGYVVYPQPGVETPSQIVELANHSLEYSHEIEKAEKPLVRVGNDSVRRNLYKENPHGGQHYWAETQMGKELEVSPFDGIFVVAIREDLLATIMNET